MQTVLIVIHFLVVIALVGVVLMQPSEGGGLGMGNSSGFMSARGTKNFLTRLTAILAVCFFMTSICLVVVGNVLDSGTNNILNRIPTATEQDLVNEGASGDALPPDNRSRPYIPEQSGGSPSSSKKQGESAASAVEDFVSPSSAAPVSDGNVQ